jgi:putative transposase
MAAEAAARELAGVKTYDQLKHDHNGWVEEYLGDEHNRRDEKWTKSIAVGSKGFVEGVKNSLGVLATGRKISQAAEAYQLREPSALYGDGFGVKNDDIGVDNSYFWDIKPE